MWKDKKKKKKAAPKANASARPVVPGLPQKGGGRYLRSALLSAGSSEKAAPGQCLGQSVHGYLLC